MGLWFRVCAKRRNSYCRDSFERNRAAGHISAEVLSKTGQFFLVFPCFCRVRWPETDPETLGERRYTYFFDQNS